MTPDSGLDYDEFQFLKGHAEWAGIDWPGPPVVCRDTLQVEGRMVSYLRWGESLPELVLLHGAGQNAHTWDTFALALNRPCLAVDLPGHGQSSWREDRDYSAAANAVAVAAVVEAATAGPVAVVAMSLGGLTALRLSTTHPNLVRALVVIDITPGAKRPNDVQAPTALLGGPRSFPSFEAILDTTHATMPHRSRESLVPGLRHNARRDADGTWRWRYDELHNAGDPPRDSSHLWDDVAALRVPALWVKGERSAVMSEAAMDELRRRLPAVRIDVVAGAGHAVQNDKPVELAAIVEELFR